MENEIASLVNILGNFGFPIMITVYLFVRFEKKIENLEKVISELLSTIRELNK
ncbi:MULTISPECIES: YvrJ family protein [Virgibacillus]|uniref:YvrJ family protein n=1 Tax=Virgibacillus TaxID=84406 RepID=UPI0009344563|nr:MULTISPECIES: YvrJ family protein [Virgibacillus]MBS7429373.1 YvrJ family protein [Virgibacillus sp. 19R1-5]MED3737811.1 YvrJ family protein [Virgibacillus pantothenticus]QTY15114.1 YvrJ family protein [Virgibacillus pantothenticus]SIT14114.1 YvrJ protein family protein [Virgibacillus pantothenticus]